MTFFVILAHFIFAAEEPNKCYRLLGTNFSHSGQWTIAANRNYLESNTRNSYAFAHFSGTGVYLHLKRINYDGRFDLTLDGQFIKTINVDSNDWPTAYINESLPFGDHSLKITVIQGTISIDYLSVKPAEDHDLLYIKLENCAPNRDSTSVTNPWIQSEAADRCWTNRGTTYNFSDIVGSRFYLTGTYNPSHYRAKIAFDKEVYYVDFTYQKSTGFVTPYGLMFQSGPVDLKSHTLRIGVVDGEVFEICSLLVVKRPKDHVMVAYNEMDRSNFPAVPTYSTTATTGAYLTFGVYATSLYVMGDRQSGFGRYDLKINDNTIETINQDHTSTSLIRNVINYHSSSLQTTDACQLKIQKIDDGGKNIFLRNTFYMYTATITPPKFITETLSSQLLQKSGTWHTYPKENTEYIYSTTQGSTLTFTFTGVRFLLESLLEPRNIKIEITIDGQTIPQFKTFRESPQKVIFYQSPIYPNAEHRVTIKNCDYASLSKIYLIHDYSGYHRIPYDELPFPTSGWTVDSTADVKYSTSSGAYVEYTFKGTKFLIVADKGPNQAPMEVSIDGTTMPQVTLESTSLHQKTVVFESNDLQYGSHTIRISSVSSGSKVKINIHCLYIQTQIRTGETIQFKSKSGLPNSYTVNQIPSGIHGTGSIPIKFHGTRFWLTGTKGPNRGKVRIVVDGQQVPETPDEYSAVEKPYYLLYSSQVMGFGEHTVQVSNYDNKAIYLTDLIYCQRPLNADVVLISEMDRSGQWSTTDGLKYSTVQPNAYVQYNVYCSDIWLIGVKGPNRGLFDFYIGSISNFKDTDTSSLTERALLHTSTKLSLTKYLIKAQKYSSAGMPIELYYLFYRTPTITPSSKHVAQAVQSIQNGWLSQTMNGNSYLCSVSTSPYTLTFKGGQFWLEGVVGCKYGTASITVDNQDYRVVSLYREEEQTAVYFQSGSLPFRDHTITITPLKSFPVTIKKLYYMPMPTSTFTPSDDFTPSKSFTKSSSFTTSDDFSSSCSFSSSIQFSESISFSASADFSESDYLPSGYFTESSGFSHSTVFSSSLSFTESSLFTKSTPFTGSSTFTGSSAFSFSSFFNNSISFTLRVDEATTQPIGGNGGSSMTKGSKSSTLGLILGLVIGCLVVVALIIFLILYMRSRRRSNPEENDDQGLEFPSTTLQVTQGDLYDDDSINSQMYDPFHNAAEPEFE